jgi:hypothetical protein
MRGLYELVTKHGACGSFVDGTHLESKRYQKNYPRDKEQLSKTLFEEIIAAGSESFPCWAPYNYVQQLMSQSKLLVGVHHPVAAPSMAEIVAHGGFPVQFENQHTCPPYNHVDIPFIPEGSSDEEIRDFIVEMWTNEDLFVRSVLTCQSAIETHSSASVSVIVENFIGSL